MGTLYSRQKHNVSMFEKNMEFSLRVGDMSFFVFFKFEIGIFDIVQGMTENKPFAFLYVLSIFFFFRILKELRVILTLNYTKHQSGYAVEW